jgi:Flp pilus assembly protein TadG
MYEMSRLTSKRRGTAIVEGALTLILLLTLFFGIMEFGRLMWSRNLLAHAAKEGSRYASVRGLASGRAASSASIATFVKGQMIGLDKNTAVVTTTWTPDNKQGSTVQVQVSYNYAPVMKMVRKTNITIKSSSKMIIAQ